MEPYTLTKKAYGEHVRGLFKAKAVPVAWDDIQVDDVIVDSKYRVYSIVSIAPKRGYMLAEHTKTGGELRMNRKAFEGEKLLKLPPRMVGLAFLEHEASVKGAIAANDHINHWIPKVVIPPEVKYDYPDLFTPMPEHWDSLRKMHVRHALQRMSETYFNEPFRPANKAKLGIEHELAGIAELEAVVIGPDTIKREETRQELIEYRRNQIAEYEWILKHIETTIGLEAGGIDVPDRDAEAAA